jgi:hypothetical protein
MRNPPMLPEGGDVMGFAGLNPSYAATTPLRRYAATTPLLASAIASGEMVPIVPFPGGVLPPGDQVATPAGRRSSWRLRSLPMTSCRAGASLGLIVLGDTCG